MCGGACARCGKCNAVQVNNDQTGAVSTWSTHCPSSPSNGRGARMLVGPVAAGRGSMACATKSACRAQWPRVSVQPARSCDSPHPECATATVCNTPSYLLRAHALKGHFLRAPCARRATESLGHRMGYEITPAVGGSDKRWSFHDATQVSSGDDAKQGMLSMLWILWPHACWS